MLKNISFFILTLALASIILVISIFRIAQVRYVFSQSPNPTPSPSKQNQEIDYQLPFPGKITPDNVLWPFKALRDKIWLTVTINPEKKADLYLLLADKRLVDSKMLFDQNKPDLAVAVLTKAEKYLELSHDEERLARSQNMDTTACLEHFTLATLKHRQMIDAMIQVAPEDAKPLIIKTQNYSKNLYNEARNGLLEAGLPVPNNPFE